MKRAIKGAVVATSVAFMLCAEVAPQAPVGVVTMPSAHAVVGMPLTPVSVAGVARRTTYRTVAVAGAATATAATAAAASSAAAAGAAAAMPVPARPPPPVAAAAPAPPPMPVAPAPMPAAPVTAVPAPPPGAPAPEAGPLPIGTVVTALPAGCVSTPVGGQQYFYCGGNFFRPAFSGNNLVYVTAHP